ncbi:hypothetical protein J6590_023172 [Homalodisca vitripennis]|nr:hypothetical protein J6590_023172 [Homalodisca vitripennis]
MTNASEICADLTDKDVAVIIGGTSADPPAMVSSRSCKQTHPPGHITSPSVAEISQRILKTTPQEHTTVPLQLWIVNRHHCEDTLPVFLQRKFLGLLCCPQLL